MFPGHSNHFFLYSVLFFVIQKRFKVIIGKVLRMTAALEKIHLLNQFLVKLSPV